LHGHAQLFTTLCRHLLSSLQTVLEKKNCYGRRCWEGFRKLALALPRRQTQLCSSQLLNSNGIRNKVCDATNTHRLGTKVGAVVSEMPRPKRFASRHIAGSDDGHLNTAGTCANALQFNHVATLVRTMITANITWTSTSATRRLPPYKPSRFGNYAIPFDSIEKHTYESWNENRTIVFNTTAAKVQKVAQGYVRRFSYRNVFETELLENKIIAEKMVCEMFPHRLKQNGCINFSDLLSVKTCVNLTHQGRAKNTKNFWIHRYIRVLCTTFS